MRHADRQINTIGELVEHLREDLNAYAGPVWFRGQGVSAWYLEPKLLRGAAGLSETHFINRFKQKASFLLDKAPLGEFDWLFLMQHYGMLTRLLDWSESPLVGLYFAVEEEDHHGEDGALWCLMPTILNSKSNYRPAYEHEVPSFDDEYMQNYQPGTIAREQRSSLYPNSAILRLNSERQFIDVEPAYQRRGDIWTLEKKQLLIDSILNDYDIPKLYFHSISRKQKTSHGNQFD
jgi:hypothetical protein